MKNIVFGAVGIIMMIFLLVTFGSIQEAGTRRNVIDNHLSRIVRHTLEKDYGTNLSKNEIKNEMEMQLKALMGDTSDLKVELRACDMKKGILSVEVTNQFLFPNHKKGTIKVKKTAIVDQVN